MGRALITVIAVPSVPFPYSMNGVVLDSPDQITGSILNGGAIPAHASFIVLWRSPSIATQNALVNGTVGSLTFAAHDGSKITTAVQVSRVLTGTLLLVTFRVLVGVSVYRYVIVTQCY